MTALGTIVAASPLNANDATRYLGFSTASDTDEIATFALGDTPSDFQTMNTLSWTYDGRESITGGDDRMEVLACIRNAAGTVVLAGASSTYASRHQQIYLKAAGGFSTTDVTRGPTAFTYVNTTASKADWDGAIVEIRAIQVKNKAPDTVRPEPDYFAITGDYTAGTNNYDETGRQLTITSTLTRTDVASFDENRSLTITSTVSGTDVVPGLNAALVVADKATPTAGDAQLNTWLTDLGFSVTYFSDEDAEATGYALVMISESCNSTTLGTKYKDTTIPTINFENGSWDDHNYLSAPSGTIATDTTWDIADDTHPLAAGLKGTGITVFNTPWDMRYGADADLPASAIKVINIKDTTTQWSLFAFESGASIHNADTTESRRVCMSLLDTSTTSLVAQGRWIIEQAVRWVTQLDVGADLTKGHLLWVVQNADLLAGDEAIADRFRNTLGYKVTCFLDSDVVAADATGFDLVCISKSGQAADVADKFKSFSGGVWWFEDNLQAISVATVPMMATIDKTDPPGTAWHTTGTSIVIDSGAPVALTGGLTGSITLLSSADEITYAPNDCGGLNGTCLAADAIGVAEFGSSGDGRWAYYAYESGSTLADSTLAAGRRVFFPLYHDDVDDGMTFDLLTADGLTLFDASINWAASSLFPLEQAVASGYDSWSGPLDIPIATPTAGNLLVASLFSRPATQPVLPREASLYDDFSGDLSKWTDLSDGTASYSIDTGELLLDASDVNSEARAQASGLSITDVEVTGKHTVGSADLGIHVRSDADYPVGVDVPTTSYFLNLQETGQNLVQLFSNDSVNGQVLIGSFFRVSAVTDYRFRFRVQGTSLKVRVWEDGTPEPTNTWPIDITDDKVTAAGSIEVTTYNNNVSNATVRCDEIAIFDLNQTSEWTRGPSIEDVTNGDWLELYYKVADGDEEMIRMYSTLDGVGGDMYAGVVAEYSGFTGTPTLDQTATNGPVTATSVASGTTGTLADAVSLALATFSGRTFGNATATFTSYTNSFTEIGEHGQTDVGSPAVRYTLNSLAALITDSTAAISTTATATDSGRLMGAIATFYDAGGAFNETGRQLTIVASVAETDTQAHDETGRAFSSAVALQVADAIAVSDALSIAVASTITGTDSQGATEDLALSVTSTVTGTDVFTPTAFDETGKSITISSTVTGTDIQASSEALAFTITSTIDGTDGTFYTDDLAVTISSTLTATDTTSYTEALQATATATITGTDTQASNENLSDTITSTVTSTDSAALSEALAFTINSTVTGTDTYEPAGAFVEDRSITITSTVTGTDVHSMSEDQSVDITSTLTPTDSVTLTDTLSIDIVSALTSTDQAALSDTVSIVGTVSLTAADTVALTESQAFTINAAVTGTDATTDEEAHTVTVIATVAVTDVLSATEAASVDITSTLTGTDSLNLTENVSVDIASTLVGTDIASFVDSEAFTISSTVTGTDAQQATASENVSFTITSSVTATDAFAATDVLEIGTVSSFTVTDTFSATEQINFVINSTIVGSDGTFLAEDLSLVITSTVTGADLVVYSDNVAVTINSSLTSVDMMASTESLDFVIISTLRFGLGLIVPDFVGARVILQPSLRRANVNHGVRQVILNDSIRRVNV